MDKGAPQETAQRYIEAIKHVSSEKAVFEAAAAWIVFEFDKYYAEFQSVPGIAKQAFEQLNPALSVAISKQRLSLYSKSMRHLGQQLQDVLSFEAEDQILWDKLESAYWDLVSHRYEADLALAYVHSVRRSILRGEWKPVDYSFGKSVETYTPQSQTIIKPFHIKNVVTVDRMIEMISTPNFETRFRNIKEDAILGCERLNEILNPAGGDSLKTFRVEVFNAGFYRNRGAYVVGRISLESGVLVPLIFALVNSEDGIYLDAILHTEADAHNLFSSTLANFHVTTAWYHELAEFLHRIMPARPIGLHYSTIGYNHFGKVAVMNELGKEVAQSGEKFTTAPGFQGTVAMGFSTPSSAFNLKIIRDKPTSGYKWGEFEGVDAVLKKYSRVHDINRTGSMLDNIIYYNVKLNKNWFEKDLLNELLTEAPGNISEFDNGIVFKHLIVQIRMIPLPLFLESASEDDAITAIRNLGDCIKNNMAANIFNKDLDARNYGVSRYLKVYLYDYDALEKFTEVKIRTNMDRFDGEEDIPDWYFEDGVIFLPEEIESGLCINDRELIKVFRHYHGDLKTPEYWQKIQNELRQSAVPNIRVYPEERKLSYNNRITKT